MTDRVNGLSNPSMDSAVAPATARGTGRRRALAYVRCSTARQGTKDGPERQKRCILRYARQHGIDVVEAFSDTVSGARELADREGLSLLFQRLGENSIDLVLLERSDRLARDVVVSEVLLRQLGDRKVSVIATDSGTDLTVSDGDATRKLLRQLLACLSEFEKTVITQRMLSARAAKRRRGERAEGPVRFGGKDGEAVVLAKMRTLRRRKGPDGRRWSYAKVAAALNEQAFTTRYGRSWSGPSVHHVLTRGRS